jgi:ABC-type dipeptide/oligopeptide/nickel transport system permease subunit
MSWWIATPTVFCMVSTLVLVNFVGEAVRDAFDPRKTDA